ncbi:inactive protein RESTRICTED TEV MOVEMENT 2 [Lactuca sativa]|uniref:SHSP domain-containing protein n=1 Tax=Lactuca sativa TaxID=4236 RepID=A0A9R1VXK3_LACSA|nr:inactive protein RESTRICTED TEV MOVEMENT 2 [Lactuca sativa]KAJ0212580.1 hypothetical protein LSAT_V11C400181320 [Lactuca sativa]
MDSKGRTTPTHVYQQLEPSIEWVNEDDCNTLLVYLPGFTKEQLRVQLRSKTLIISGERKLHDNAWIRFRKEFIASEQCVISKISAKFEGSILFVKQPKSVAPMAEEEGKPPIEAPAPKPEKPIDETKKHQKRTRVEHDTKPTSTTESNDRNGVGQNAKKDSEKNVELKEQKGVCENASEKKVSDLGFVMKMKPSKNVVNLILVLVVGLLVGVYCSEAIKSCNA